MNSFPKLLMELIGTFVFLFVLLSTNNLGTGIGPIAVGIGLTAAIFIAAPISGAHLNPAITIMQTVNKMIDPLMASGYIIAQIIGGLMALGVYKLAYLPK